MDISGSGQDGLVRARLHADNMSKTLRATTVARCRWCGNLVEWFDKADGGRIPLTPMEFPKSRVPLRYRWTVDRGIAYPGSHERGDQFCRLAHPAICPATDHEDLDDALETVVQALRVRMRRSINAGTFTPQVEDDLTEEDIREPEPASAAAPGSVRHTLSYADILRIAPGPVTELGCVAMDRHTRQRCEGEVFAADEGQWEQTETPPVIARGRRGTLTTFRGPMWVWALRPLDFRTALRWLHQHCAVHHFSSSANAVPVELVDFRTDKHAPFILRKRPEGFELPAALEQEAEGWNIRPMGERTQCAGAGCPNGTVVAVAKGWLCYMCERLSRRRTATNRRWQQMGQQPAETSDHP